MKKPQGTNEVIFAVACFILIFVIGMTIKAIQDTGLN